MKYCSAFSVSGHAGSVWQLPVHATVHRGVCEATATHWHPHLHLPCSSGCRLLPLTHAVRPQHSRESRTSLFCSFQSVLRTDHPQHSYESWHLFVLLPSVCVTDHPPNSCESCTCLFCCLQSLLQTIPRIHVSHVLVCSVAFSLTHTPSTAFMWVMYLFVVLPSVLHTHHPLNSCESCTCLFCCLQSYTHTIPRIHVSHVLVCSVAFSLTHIDHPPNSCESCTLYCNLQSYAQTIHRYFFVLEHDFMFVSHI